MDSKRCVEGFCLFYNQDFASGRGIAAISTIPNLERIKVAVNQSSSGPDDDPSAYRITEIEGKGIGLVADKALHRGSPIMSKTPVLLVHRTFMESVPPATQRALLGSAVGLLPSSTRSLFLAQAAHADGSDRIASIMATNSFQMDVGGPDGHHYGNFPEVSRLNHDCRPNLAFFVGPDLAHTTTAVRDVQPGEELTISYLNAFEPRAVRRARARAAWGFECSCSQCRRPDAEAAASDRRLEEIARIEARLTNFRSEDVSWSVIRRFDQLHRDERLEAAMSGVYTLAALNNAMLGDEKMAVRYAELAAEAGRMEHGPGSGDVRAMEELMRDPRGHFTWRKRVDG